MPDLADPPGADVLVAVHARAELGLRVVEVDHHQPLEPDPRVEVGEEGVGRRRVGEVDSRRPRRGRCRGRTRPARSGRRARRGPRRWPPARRRRARARSRRRPSSRATSIGRRPAAVASTSAAASRATPVGRAALDARPSTPAPRCEPMWTLTNRAAERRARPAARWRARDRALEEVRVGAGEVDQVRGVDRDGAMPCSASRCAEGRELRRRRGAAPPGRRVVAEDLERGRADLGGAVGGLDHAVAERRGGRRGVVRRAASAPS